MKVKIEICPGLEEDEVTIRCGELNDAVLNLQAYAADSGAGGRKLPLRRGDTEYYVALSDILFFETQGREIQAHTADKLFETGYKLYELEEQLPGYFMRISKSTIVNLEYIYSITRNLTASSVVEFAGSPKKVYVSRSYYKALIERLEEKRRRAGGLNAAERRKV